VVQRGSQRASFTICFALDLEGKTLSTELTNQALATALTNAAPLTYNAEKIDMAKGLLASGLEKLAAS